MDLFETKTILTVSRLTTLLRGVLEENFEHVWVQGEVSNLSLPSSGHIYLTLKDSGAQLRCVMFKGAAKNLKFRVTDGMELIIRGHVSVFDQRGEYQLICEYLEPAGVGALQTAFVQLKERLAAEGLFNEANKLPMPMFPRRLGIVTSPTGAAIHDILNILKRRHASLEILLYPVRVQGEGAAAEIAKAVDEMNRLALADVLIVGRGGGSLEDLWAFNEEVVARAVYRSRIPVVSAVGHETDWTICDFAADLRAPTPSAAAEMVIASADELRNRVEYLAHRLRLNVEKHLASYDSRLESLRRALHDPSSMLGHLSQRVDSLEERLEMALNNLVVRRRDDFERKLGALKLHNPARLVDAMRRRATLLSAQAEKLMVQRLQDFRQRFTADIARLEVLSPLSTLSRGYSIVTRVADGKVVADSAQLAKGDRLRHSFYRGKAVSMVESVEEPNT